MQEGIASRDELARQNRLLREQIEELQQTLDAIRNGEVDALVVSTSNGEQVFTLRGADQSYRILIEGMREGAAMLTDDGTILYSNSGLASILKIPLDKLIGRNIKDLISPRHMDAFNQLIEGVRNVGREVTKEITVQPCSGEPVPTIMSFSRLGMDDAVANYLVVTDLTEHMAEDVRKYTGDLEHEVRRRIEAEEALRESEQRWVTTLTSIGDAVIATDLAGRITFMNRAAEALTGWNLSEASGKELTEVFRIINEFTRTGVENPVTKVIEKGIVVGLANHTILIQKNSREVPIDDSGAPIKDAEGKTEGVVLVFRDITERKMMEERLKDSERLSTIGATTAMVGHDLRNPLQAIMGYIALTKLDMENISSHASQKLLGERLDEIKDQTLYMNKIVSDLQDYARPLEPDFRETDLMELVAKVLQTMQFSSNIEVTNMVPDDLARIMVDSSLMTRVFTNLFRNAAEAMPDGGKLIIGASLRDESIEVRVSDTGVGVHEKNKDKLFTPLFTTKAKGQGFGLPVCKRIVEAHNGKISFESKLGKGTTFTIELPYKTSVKS